MTSRVRAYAAKTKVSVDKSRAELEGLLARHGATQRAFLVSDKLIVVGFIVSGRKYRLDVPMPENEVRQRERWRAIVLCVKAKLELVRIGLSTVEREFLADLVLPDGQTAAQAIGKYMEKLIANGYSAPLALPEART
jgi:hypothetical protein